MSHRFEPGTRIGRYEVLRRLGAGAMGEVHLAQDPSIGRLLAVKTVRAHEDPDDAPAERSARLVREARAAGRLLHANIVTLFDAGEQDGFFYLAFEYVDGQDLHHHLLANRPLALDECLRIAAEVAAGLAHAHQQGIVHRDVKPSNVLIDKSGQAKIADFGIAKLAGQATELTTAGTVIGSPHYLAPEQIRGEALDGRADLFSLGVMLYEMVSGHRPFEGETISTLVYQILHQEPRPVRELRPDLPPAVAAVITRLLAKDRDRRYPDAAAAAAALTSARPGFSGATTLLQPALSAADRPLGRPQARPGDPAADTASFAGRPGNSARRRRLGRAAVGVVVVGAMVAIFAPRREDPAPAADAAEPELIAETVAPPFDVDEVGTALITPGGTYAARQAIAFVSPPPRARVVVDGKVVGPAILFNGVADGWLELAPGVHQLHFVLPGRKLMEISVEVSDAAPFARLRLESAPLRRLRP